MIPLFLYTFGFLITLASALLAAWSDFRSFRIPNVYTVLALVGFGCAYAGVVLVPGDKIPLLHPYMAHLASAGVFFVITLILFAIGSIGAGDAKYASALALWPGLLGLPVFVFYMSLAGGILGLTTLFLKKKKVFKTAAAGTWIFSAQEGQNRIPYGIAIAFGFLMTAISFGYYDVTAIINSVEGGG